MKNSIKYLLLSAAALAAVSCESWLDVTPPSEIRAEAHYSSAEGFQQTLIGCYLAMGEADLYGENLTWHMIEMLGRQYDARKNTAADDYDLDRYNYKTTKSTEVIEKVWEKSYSVIANVNDALDHIDRRKDGLDSVNYRIIKGELLAVRAYIHFDLMRLFGGERVTTIMNTLRTPEDMPIESKMISNVIESSQKRVESRNFSVRKSVLSFDDVMNRQRELIYKQRDQVLDGENLKPVILKMLDECIAESIDFYCPKALSHSDWNIAGLREKFLGWLTTPEDFVDGFDREDAKEELTERGHKIYDEREELMGVDENGVPIMRALERMVLLKMVDSKWMDHIDAMEELKRGIGLRSYGQQDPVVAFRQESYDIFDEMTMSIREDTVRLMMTIMPKNEEDTKRKQVAEITSTSGASDGSEKGRTVRKGAKIGPNDPCPCGSGKKYKKCCGAVNK